MTDLKQIIQNIQQSNLPEDNKVTLIFILEGALEDRVEDSKGYTDMDSLLKRLLVYLSISKETCDMFDIDVGEIIKKLFE